MTGAARPALTLAQQADFVDGLVLHCTMLGGVIAGETHLTITASEVEDLLLLGARLRRMAPHESAIKRLVIGSK